MAGWLAGWLSVRGSFLAADEEVQKVLGRARGRYLGQINAKHYSITLSSIVDAFNLLMQAACRAAVAITF
jgi:hypothetical protein